MQLAKTVFSTNTLTNNNNYLKLGVCSPPLGKKATGLPSKRSGNMRNHYVAVLLGELKEYGIFSPLAPQEHPWNVRETVAALGTSGVFDNRQPWAAPSSPSSPPHVTLGSLENSHREGCP